MIPFECAWREDTISNGTSKQTIRWHAFNAIVASINHTFQAAANWWVLKSQLVWWLLWNGIHYEREICFASFCWNIYTIRMLFFLYVAKTPSKVITIINTLCNCYGASLILVKHVSFCVLFHFRLVFSCWKVSWNWNHVLIAREKKCERFQVIVLTVNWCHGKIIHSSN